MNTSDYIAACWNLCNEFDASPEALAHLAFCQVNLMLKHGTDVLRKARVDNVAEASEWNFNRIETRRRELLVWCQQARMLIAASRAERLARTSDLSVLAAYERAEMLDTMLHEQGCAGGGYDIADVCDALGVEYRWEEFRDITDDGEFADAPR